MSEVVEVSKEVRRGAALLDEERPNWFEEIDLDELKMANCNHCILGQIYGEYDAGIEVLSGEGIEEIYGPDQGFDREYHLISTKTERFQSYESLQAQWTAVINHRLNEGGTKNGNA
jgi:hypothetical protein